MYENGVFLNWDDLFFILLIFICMQSRFDNIKIFIILINYGFD